MQFDMIDTCMHTCAAHVHTTSTSNVLCSITLLITLLLTVTLAAATPKILSNKLNHEYTAFHTAYTILHLPACTSMRCACIRTF